MNFRKSKLFSKIQHNPYSDVGREKKLIGPYFDREYYSRNNLDVIAAGIDPVVHYLKYGWKEYRDPCPYFCVRWYLTRYSDVHASGQEPLSHFLRTGMKEGRQPHHLIDLSYYAGGASDVIRAGVDLYTHFINHGDLEGRGPHPLFDPDFYYCKICDNTELAPFAHYVEHGTKQSPHPGFDADYYAKLYMNGDDDIVEPILHYLLAPKGSRRHFHPLLDGDYQQISRGSEIGTFDPLIEYAHDRGHFNEADKRRGATTIPQPKRLPLKSGGHELAKKSTAKRKLVSVVMPCYNSDLHFLTQCVDSIRAQTYNNWELILVNDGSPDPKTSSELKEIASLDNRIKTIELDKNLGISEATNVGLHAARGTYIALVDHDDMLASNAIEMMVDSIEEKQADVGYSDQAYIDIYGNVDEKLHKPKWSPVLMTGVMYVGHLLVVKKSIAISVGTFDSTYDGCQDFEFMLRISEKTERIIHIPEVLYYWRRAPGSIAADSNAKGKVDLIQMRAVNAHLKRINLRAKATVDDRIAHRLRLVPNFEPKIIECDVILNDQNKEPPNGIIDSKAFEIPGLKIAHVQWTNDNQITNEAIEKGCSEWILFFSPQIKVIDEHWIAHLQIYAELPNVAFVAPHIFTEDGRVVMAGLVADNERVLLPSQPGLQDGDDGHAGSLICDREVSAVSGICALVQRKTFAKLNGLKHKYTSVDVAVAEAAYRATQMGFNNISVAKRLVETQHPLQSNNFRSILDRQLFFDDHIEQLNLGDGYYNRNFSSPAVDYKYE